MEQVRGRSAGHRHGISLFMNSTHVLSILSSQPIGSAYYHPNPQAQHIIISTHMLSSILSSKPIRSAAYHDLIIISKSIIISQPSLSLGTNLKLEGEKDKGCMFKSCQKPNVLSQCPGCQRSHNFYQFCVEVRICHFLFFNTLDSELTDKNN